MPQVIWFRLFKPHFSTIHHCEWMFVRIHAAELAKRTERQKLPRFTLTHITNIKQKTRIEDDDYDELKKKQQQHDNTRKTPI